MSARAQLLQQGAHAFKQRDLLLQLEVVVGAEVGQVGVLVARHIGRGMGQRRPQGHTDHIGCLFVAGALPADIQHGLLNAARDRNGGVEQGAIPVEGNQIKTTAVGTHDAFTLSPRVTKSASSPGNGASRVSASPVAGCCNCRRHACKNMRLRPCLGKRLLSSKSPYLSSPAMPCPGLDRCTRIWCVRPVLMVTSSKLMGGNPCRLRAGSDWRTFTNVRACMASVSSAVVAPR